MATGRMNQLVVMVNLCSSVVEGIEHLITSQGNDRLKEDAVSGLLTLEENLKVLQADKTVIHETRWMAEVIKNWLFVYDREFRDRLYRWYFTALKELRNLMFAEIEICPVCSGKGAVHYGASLYMEGDEAGKELLKPVRIFMKCGECGNYYLAKEEPWIIKRKKRAERSRARCSRILADIKGLASDGSMLFIGSQNSQLYKEAASAGYEISSLIESEAMNSGKKGSYGVVIIEHLTDSRDMNAILDKAADCLADGGILWFDGPDLDKSMDLLEKKGSVLWREAASEVYLTREGTKNLAKLFGLTVKSLKRVGTTRGRIEVIAKKA
ncbi:hypothetical protein LAD12857_41130 [Lacrimispora amygdalina]|uniref:Methyltransferase domain-containing protein n=1 Tax=Lacrimispora amygdalina TaxID=253257 RepID=A0A3E2NCH6_9FIRM|nr:hypothetical protein [Clostridium indicum]RFZ78590.1 hypothetical protein DS742_11995 [Clostridium indicum]